MKIKEYQDKTIINDPLLVTAVSGGVTNTNAPYLSITFRDNSGTIEGKLWNVKDSQSSIVKVGEVINVKGEVRNYRNALQLKVMDVSAIDQNSIDIRDFVLRGPYDKETLKTGINDAIRSISNTDIYRVVADIYRKYDEQIYSSSAAIKNHHEYHGGLATHIYSMLKLAEMFCANYPYLNRDLLIAGVLLHDIGKIEELSSGSVSEYTIQGKLLGHISISQTIVKETAERLGIDSEAILVLRHMILAHHGKMEFGSPVLPATIEAEALHFIDDIDAKLTMIEKELRNVPEGEFTNRNFALENRAFYHHKVK